MKNKTINIQPYPELLQRLHKYQLQLGPINNETWLATEERFVRKGLLALPVEFGWLHNLGNHRKTSSYNLVRCMGYDVARIQGKHYINTVHPYFQGYFSALSLAIYDQYSSTALGNGEMGYSLCFPLMTRNRTPMLVQRFVTPALVDEGGRIAAVEVRNVIIGRYQGEAPHWAIFSPPFSQKNSVINHLERQLRHYLPSPFTVRQEQILEIIFQNEGAPLGGLANLLGLTTASLKTHTRNILERARLAFPPEAIFRDVGEVARYWARMMRGEGI